MRGGFIPTPLLPLAPQVEFNEKRNAIGNAGPVGSGIWNQSGYKQSGSRAPAVKLL